MKRSFVMQITGLTAGLFVAILGANLVHDWVILQTVRSAIHQSERADEVEKLAFHQWKADRLPVYPALYSCLDDPRYPTQTSDLGHIYFKRERPAYIQWAERQVP